MKVLHGWLRAGLGGASLLGILSCGAEPPEARSPGAEEDGLHLASGHQSGPHWDYQGHGGPSGWSSLDPTFQLCEAGRSQSPIDLTDSGSDGPTELRLVYTPVEVVMTHNGHTVELPASGGGGLELDGVPHALQQLHFHAPSEHTLEGRAFPLEMHLVHEGPGGEREVVSLLFEEGAENPAYRDLLAQVPAKMGETVVRPDLAVDLLALLPVGTGYLRYEGSLTTPPCTEGVTWYVIGRPETLSAAQIGAISEVLSPNNRPVQPPNGRETVFIPHVSDSGER